MRARGKAGRGRGRGHRGRVGRGEEPERRARERDDTRGVLFWLRGTSRPSSTGSSDTPRRRPRVMKPRPPQSKHASSLPLTVHRSLRRSLDISRSRSFLFLGEAPGLRVEVSISPLFLAAASHVVCEIALKKSYRIISHSLHRVKSNRVRARHLGDSTRVVRENESGEKVRGEE